MANALTVDAGCTSINSVQVAWGPHDAPQPVTVALYDDPNDDGDPSDITGAHLLTSADGYFSAMPDTNTYIDYPVPKVDVTGLGVIFVLATTEDIGGNQFPLSIDESVPPDGFGSQMSSWMLLGINDVANPFGDNEFLELLDGAEVGNPGNFMVRAADTGVNKCPTDIIVDYQTNVDDLVFLILAWGTSNPVADINGDGVVGVDDQVELILGWGPCSTDNDDCDSSRIAFGGTGTLFLGEVDCEAVTTPFSSIGATLDGGAFGCGTAANDVWFEATAVCNGIMIVDTDNSDYDTLLEAYDVTDCGALGKAIACDNDSGAGALTSRIEFPVSFGDRVKIRVGGGDLGAEGVGKLNICCVLPLPDPPPNDDCANAITLVPGGDSDSQQTTTAAEDDVLPCGLLIQAPGAWYTFEGTGNSMTLSLCNKGTDYDTILNLYCSLKAGDCSDLGCVTADDDGCGMPGDGVPSEITFCSELGRTYYAFVQGWNGSTGNFEISLADVGGCGTADPCEPIVVPANDLCDDAIPIKSGLTDYSTLLASLTEGATIGGCENNTIGPDVWFTYTAVGTTDDVLLTVSTCEDLGVGATADFDTDIRVFAADGGLLPCDDLAPALLGCNDDGCPIGAPAAPWHSNLAISVANGQEVLIELGGFAEGDVGTGTVFVGVEDADNDLCLFPTEVASAGATIALDLCGATIDGNAPICGSGQAADRPGRWLRFAGTGNEVTVELQNLNNAGVPLDFADTRLAVYCGTPKGGWDCTDLECAADEPVDNNPNAPFTEVITWCSEVGRDYLILVQSDNGMSDEECQIDVFVSEAGACDNPPCPVFPIADHPEDALDVTPNINGDLVQGDNCDATPDDLTGNDADLPEGSPTCHWSATPTAVHNTVWYVFEAPANGSITVDDCTMAPSDFRDSSMTLYSGTPGAFTEIACSEDECGAPNYFGNFSVTTLTSGESYYIMFGNTGGWGGSTCGDFQFTITSP
jgi:hypothetical protein